MRPSIGGRRRDLVGVRTGILTIVRAHRETLSGSGGIQGHQASITCVVASMGRLRQLDGLRRWDDYVIWSHFPFEYLIIYMALGAAKIGSSSINFTN